MPGYMTLDQRKIEKRKKQLQAFESVCQELRRVSGTSSGAFYVFGSFVDNSFTPSSDLDVLVDFPEVERVEAMRFVEDMCYRFGLSPDIRPSQWCSEPFVSKVKCEGVKL